MTSNKSLADETLALPEAAQPATTRKRHRRMLWIGLAVLIGSLIAAQFWPSSLNPKNPPVIEEPNWDSPETRVLTQRACFDCHSNETVWPWYSRVAPMSWLVEKDIVEGRAALNFSEWHRDQDVQTEEVVELISIDEMPLPYYVILHPEARLSASEKGRLINGLIDTPERGKSDGLETEDLDDSAEPQN
jgi:hypothetical protein